MSFVTFDDNGNITLSADWAFPGSEEVSYDVVRGYDGKLYKVGDEPVRKQTESQAAKRVEINAGFDAAMTASLTMPSASTPPSPFSVYQAIEEWKSEDPEGFAYIMQTHEARRAALLAAVDAATSVEAVESIAVSYAV